MQKQIELGAWGDKADPTDRTYEEWNPAYDMREFETFPGAVGSPTSFFEWVAPADGDYYVTIASNCGKYTALLLCLLLLLIHILKSSSSSPRPPTRENCNSL